MNFPLSKSEFGKDSDPAFEFTTNEEPAKLNRDVALRAV
jgi:hypothetical protein